ncbi:mitochondrial mRNA pseudouridine synthase TRUB2 isoform X2 [Dunckerocampus dactyliophorus]|uniref:mitochondrial mRNA pseudouridine synthase TRUB2 isoform X2 n=1 Tax=Dunckerocampus dactyliophorus TaxID=161453 RepID=UPI002404AE4A|nr:mitochondrial mRNA pseudouridine synthase TRUB2 isoform X2 [Dunckerocampus dactyliophorus]
MASPAARIYRRLEGLFCVYKPSGIPWKLVRDTIETKLLKGLDASPSLPLPQQIRFLPQPGSDTLTPKGLSAVSVPILSKHPLVLGVGNGNKVLNDLHNLPVTRDYTLEGEFGTATDDFSHTGRVVERSTYDHITQDKLDRVLAMLQGANQKALLTYANVDMRSQEAYEMAVQGQLGPEGKSPPILMGLRCIRFQPPNFTLEVQCLNETQKYLRKVVHEIGLELRSTAVCKGVRRTRDGVFTLQEALTRDHWTPSDVVGAVRQYHAVKKNKLSNHRSRTHEYKTQNQQDDDAGEEMHSR